LHVRARDDLIERLVSFEGRKSDAETRLSIAHEGNPNHLETALDIIYPNPADAAHKLVPSVAHDRIKRSQVRPHRGYERPQRLVSRGVAVAIIETFQIIEVDKSQHEAPVAPTGTIDLVLQRERAALAAERAGERIDLGRLQLRLETLDYEGRLGAVTGRATSVACGSGTAFVGL
jgi:hypothetical protein